MDLACAVRERAVGGEKGLELDSRHAIVREPLELGMAKITVEEVRPFIMTYALFLALLQGGQLFEPPVLVAEEIGVELADWASPLVLERLAVGDFDGDGRPDAIARSNGRAVVIWAPGSFEAFQVVDPTADVLDVAVITEKSPQRFVTAGRFDLRLWQYDPASASLSWTTISSLGYEAVCVIDWRGVPAIAGVRRGSAEVELFSLAGSTLASWNTAGTPAEITGIDWNGAPGDEIAVMGTDGVEIFDDLGTPLDQFATAGRSVSVQRVRTALGPERLAWIHELDPGLPSSSFELRVLQSSCPPLPVDAPFANAVDAADLDGDGNDDLAYALAASTKLRVLLGPCFDAAATYTQPVSGSAHADGGLAIVDADGDGDLDLIDGTRAGGLRYFQNDDPDSLEGYSADDCVRNWALPGGCLELELEYSRAAPPEAALEVLVYRRCSTSPLLVDDAPIATLSIGLQSERWSGGLLFTSNLCDPQCEYFFVSRLTMGGAPLPDTVQRYAQGAAFCHANGVNAAFGAAPRYGRPDKTSFGPKVEGLNPWPRVPLGQVGRSPGGDAP